MKNDDNTWEHAVTLEERVIKLIQEKKTSEIEFKVYLELYGRKRLLEIWTEYKKKSKSNVDKE